MQFHHASAMAAIRAATLLVIGGAMADLANAASFNCLVASTPDEVLICQDAELSRLDEQMASLYFATRNRVLGPQRQALEDTQVEWFRLRQACGRDRTCIQSSYTVRIAYLQSYNQLSPYTMPKEGYGGNLQNTSPAPATKPAPVSCDLTLEPTALASCWRTKDYLTTVNEFRANCQNDYSCLRLHNGGEGEIASCTQYGTAAMLVWLQTRGAKNMPADQRNKLFVDIQAALQIDYPEVTPEMIGAETFGDGLYGADKREVINFATNMCLAGKRF
jgi:uncharacterized protein